MAVKSNPYKGYNGVGSGTTVSERRLVKMIVLLRRTLGYHLLSSSCLLPSPSPWSSARCLTRKEGPRTHSLARCTHCYRTPGSPAPSSGTSSGPHCTGCCHSRSFRKSCRAHSVPVSSLRLDLIGIRLPPVLEQSKYPTIF